MPGSDGYPERDGTGRDLAVVPRSAYPLMGVEHGAMGRKQARKRRLAICAVFALAVAIVAPLIAPGAGAVIANPGALRISLDLSVYTPTFTVAGMSTTGAAAATMGKNGLIKIPQSSLNFEPVNVTIDLPPADTTTTAAPDPSSTTSAPPAPAAPVATTATVRAQAVGDFTGGLNPKTGAALLIGNIQELWSVPGRMTDCPVGPFQVVANTMASGSVLYSVNTGTVSVVDPGFTISAIPTGMSGCAGLESSVNAALSLPVTTTTTTTVKGVPTTTIPFSNTPPVPSIVIAMTFAPAPRAEVPAPVQRKPKPVVTSPTFTPPPAVRAPKPPASHPGRSRRQNNRRRQIQRSNHARHHVHKPKKHTGHTIIGRAVKQAHNAKVRARAHPHKKKASRKPAAAAATNNAQPNLVPASFIKRPQSALATGLDLLGLLALLVFSSLALWLVTSEMSEFSARNRKVKTHRIAGITRR
jgi:hypothetical protein